MGALSGFMSLWMSHGSLPLYPGAWEASPRAGVQPTQPGCKDFLFLQTGLRVFAFQVRLGCSPSLWPPGVLSAHWDSPAEAAEGPPAARHPLGKVGVTPTWVVLTAESSSAVLEARAEP